MTYSVGTMEIARRLADHRCPAMGCEGRLFEGNNLVRTVPFGHPEVSAKQIACDGPKMHVWDKMSLIALTPKLVKEVSVGTGPT